MKKDLKIEKEILAMLKAMVVAYNKRDAETTISFFAEKPAPVLVDSSEKNKIVGRKKIKSLFDKLFSGDLILKMRVAESSVLSENNIAVCYLKCDITGSRDAKKFKTTGCHWTIVFEKIDDKWSIISTHFSAATKK